jgi:hypothetical protein
LPIHLESMRRKGGVQLAPSWGSGI